MQQSHSNKLSDTLYQKVGGLFFAVAMADGTVHIKEVDQLKSLVREKWLPLYDREDEYGSDAAFQIEIVFDWLLENEKTSAECFASFVTFYKEHKAVFSQQVKALIYETCNAIAYSFSGKNKAELILLANLQLLFQSADT
jgi:hypothetical protein